MKKILWILLAILTFAFVGCQPNTPEGDKGETEQFITTDIEGDVLYLGYESGETTIYVDSHDQFWEYSYDEEQEWAYISDISMDGVRALVVTVEENTTGADREMVLTLTNGEKASQLTIKQSASESTPATAITPAKELYVISKDMATIDVEVAADGDYEVVIPEEVDWIELDGSEKIEGGRKENLYIHGNFGAEIREAVVTLRSKNTSAEITIKQWGSEVLKVDKTEMTLLFVAGRDSVRVDALGTYTATVSEGDWVSVVSTSEYLVFDYEENPDEEAERTAVITLTSGETTKAITLIQMPFSNTEMPEKDDWQEDVAVTITNVTATSQMSASRGVLKVYDGNTKSNWFSAMSNDAPVELVFDIDASQIERIDYLRYVPVVGSMEWGRWGEVDVYATDATGEKKVLTTNMGKGMTKVDVAFEPALSNTTTQIRIVITDAIPYVSPTDDTECANVASAAEVAFYMYNPDGFKPLDYFTDMSISELRSDVTFEDIKAIKDPFYRSLAEKIFYGIYDDEFRVCEFRAYPIPERSSEILRDKPWGMLDNVTGMYVAEANTPQYIYLDEDYGQEIYVRVVNYATDDGSWAQSHKYHDYDYRLQKGRNVIYPKNTGLMYMQLYSDDFEKIPEMKAHFINSSVNGYLKRGVHKAEDVHRIFGLATAKEQPYFDVVTNRTLINYTKDMYYRNTFQNNVAENADRVIDLMMVYDTIVYIQEEAQGLPKYSAMGLPRAHNNRIPFLGLDFHDKNGYSAWYYIGMSPRNVPKALDPNAIWNRKVTNYNNSIVAAVWTLMHELGHSTQSRMFTWCGLSEVTNNFMCIITQEKFYGQGNNTMRFNDHFNRGHKNLANRWVWDFDDKGNWYERPMTHCEATNSPELGNERGCIDLVTKIMPFWQLYLYYHYVLEREDFYPDFYELCRTKDFYEKDFANAHAYHSALPNEWVRSISEVSGHNLSEWANAWGLPGINRASGVNKGMKVNHYSEIFFVNTEEELAELKEYCSKYPKPEHDIYYIHDLNLDLYRNPQPVTAGSHTYNNGKFTMTGWSNVVAWILVDPEKLDENGEKGRIVAVHSCDDQNGGGTFDYVYYESRYIPKDEANGDYSDYFYNDGRSYSSDKPNTERSMTKVSPDYEYTASLQLYAVDAYGKRYPSASNK